MQPFIHARALSNAFPDGRRARNGRACGVRGGREKKVDGKTETRTRAVSFLQEKDFPVARTAESKVALQCSCDIKSGGGGGDCEPTAAAGTLERRQIHLSAEQRLKPKPS